MKRATYFVLLLALLALFGCSERAASERGALPAAEAPAAQETPAAVVESEPEPELEPEPEPPAPKTTVATLAVCGDVMSHMPLIEDAWNAEASCYDYRPMLRDAAPYVRAADYAVANLETTFAGGPKYSGYPRFNAPDALADALLDAGFDLLLTANNHCMDKGFAGLCRTLDVLDEAALAHIGTSRTEDEAHSDVVLADVGGISVAFLGFTYGTNGIPLDKSAPFSVNLFNTDYLTTLSTPDEAALLAALERAKTLEPDLIAVMMHWGIEYKTKQNAYQERLAQFLFDHGADIVLGGHPHVLQPMELRALTRDGAEKQGFVCYSLGNFISSQVIELTDVTAVLTLTLTRDDESGVAQVSDYAYVPMVMLHPAEGSDGHFALLDVRKALEGGAEESAELCQRSLETCHTILGTARELRQNAA